MLLEPVNVFQAKEIQGRIINFMSQSESSHFERVQNFLVLSVSHCSFTMTNVKKCHSFAVVFNSTQFPIVREEPERTRKVEDNGKNGASLRFPFFLKLTHKKVLRDKR